MAANRQGGDLKWQVLVNRLPVVVKILENPSTERKVAPASLESLKKLHDQAQALVNGQLVLPVTLDEPQRKEVDECVAGIARCLDKFPLHLLLEASQPKRAKVPLDEPATPAEGPAPLQRTASLPIPSGPATVVIPTSKSEGPPDKFGLGFSPPRSKLVVPADRGVEEVGWNPPEKFQKGFVPKHSDTGTTGLTSELLAPDGVVLHSPPMHGRTARPLGAFGGLGVASKPAFYHPGRTLPAEGGLEKENGHAAKLDQLSAPRLRGLDLADPGAQFGKSPPKSSVLSGGRAGHEEFWENGWTTIASRDLRAEIATAELDLLKESDEARAVRLQAEREAEAAAKIVRAREARQLYAGLDNGIERMQRGCAKAGAESSLRKESSSRSGEDSLSPHSSGAEADVDSQGLPGGYTDSGDKLALAGGDQRQHSFQSPRGGPSQGRALSPAARQRQQKLLLQRQLEEEGVQLELRIANGDHRPEAPKRARVPLGLSLWCSSGIEGGQEFAEGGSGSGQEDRDPSPQSPLAEKRNNVIGRQDWPEAGVLGLRKDEQHHKGGMALEAERSTPSPPVSLGLALQSGGRQNRMSNTDTLHGSVGQPLGSVGFARLELGTSRETSDVERGVKRHKDWQEDAWGRSRGAAGQPHQHVPNHPPEEERRKAGPREQAKRPRVEPSRGNLSPPPPRAANVPQKARGFDYPAALRSSVEAFLAHSSSGMSHEVGIGLNSSPPLWPPPERAAKLPPPFTQQELVQREPPSRRITRPTPPAVVPEYPLLPAHVLNRGIPEIPLQGVPVYSQLFGGVSGVPSKVPPYPKVPLDPMVYPFGAVRAVPAPPYGALPPDWASPFSPHVFAAGFDQKPRVMGGANHGIVNPLGKAMQPSWADATSRWQLPHERNRGVPEEAAEDARSQSLSWPNSTPIAPGTSLQGVHSRPNSAPVHFSRGRKDPPAARGYYETHPEVFTLGRDHPPNTFPHRTTKPQGERPAQIRTDRDISSLMPSLDLNQPPPLFEGGKLVSPSGNYLDTDPHPPVSRTRGQPGFVASPFPHIAYPETPYPVELPVTEPSNLSPPPYGKARVPPAFPMAHYPHIPYPLTVSPPRIAPDSSLYSNVHDPPLMDPSSFVLPVAYDYAALERPEGFVPPPPLQKLGYPRPPHLVAPVAYDPGQIAYDPARLPVPLHLQGAYPIPDPRSLNPSDPRALGFFPVSWAADARVQGVKNSVLQVPPDTKELAWGDPRGAAAEFARRGRPVRQYVTADKATVPARDKLRAMQAPLGVPPPVPPPPAAFANYPTWDLRASPMLPFGRNLGLACDSSVASNVVRRTDSENDLTVLPGRGDEARVPTRNESVEEIAYARRRELGSPVGDAVLGKAPVRSSRGAAHLTRLGEDPRGGMFVTEERFPRQFMQEQYLRGVEEGAKAAQWQRQCGSPQSTDVPAEPYAEDVVNRAVPSVSGTGVNKAARGHPEVRKKRSSDEATSKNSGEPETEQPPKKRSPNARMHAVGGPRGLL